MLPAASVVVPCRNERGNIENAARDAGTVFMVAENAQYWPEVLTVRDAIADGEIVRATHDGYANRFSVIHQRSIILSPDGNRLDGEDMFLPSLAQQPASFRDHVARSSPLRSDQS